MVGNGAQEAAQQNNEIPGQDWVGDRYLVAWPKGHCLQAAAVAIPNAEPQGHFLRSLVTPAFAWTVASVAFILFCSGLVKPRVDSQTRIGHRPNLPASQKLQSTFELPQQRLISALVPPSAR